MLGMVQLIEDNGLWVVSPLGGRFLWFKLCSTKGCAAQSNGLQHRNPA